MSEELYTYLNTVISDSISTGVGTRSDLQKVGLCVDWCWEPNTCIKNVGIVCPLLVGCVVLRVWLLRRWYPGVAWVSQWSAVVAVWSFRVD
jgi:hypothetical protein